MTTNNQKKKEAIDWIENHFKTNDCGWRSMPTATTGKRRRGETTIPLISVLDRDNEQLFPRPVGQPWLQLYEIYKQAMPASSVMTWAAFKQLRGDRFPENIYRIERRLCKEKGLNMASTWRNTPLHLSCANGDVNIVKSILQQRWEEVTADGTRKLLLDQQDYNGKTPLHHAVSAANNAIETVGFLLEEGAVYDLRDNNNELPIDIANRIGREDIRNAITAEHERRHTNPGYKRPRLEDYLSAPSIETSADNVEDDEESESSDDEDD